MIRNQRMQPACQDRDRITVQRREVLADVLQHHDAVIASGVTGTKKTDETVPGLGRFKGRRRHIELQRQRARGQLTA